MEQELTNRIKELEESRKALRTTIARERQKFRELQKKYLDLVQECESLKAWNKQLLESIRERLELINSINHL